MSDGFELHAVAHLSRPWRAPARDLEALREGLASAPDEVIFHQAVQHLLRSPGAAELAPDDLSAWTHGVLQDEETSERLSFAVQSHHGSPSELRQALLAVLEAVPEKRRRERAAPAGSEFTFLASVSVDFPIGRVVTTAAETVEALVESDPSVWFFHLIEEPWSRGKAPLVAWLESIGEARLASWLSEAAASGLPIGKARAALLRRWRRSQIARNLAEPAFASERERRAAGREALAKLVRRRSHEDHEP